MIDWHRHPLKRLTEINSSVLPEDTPPDYPIRYVDISNVVAGRLKGFEELLFVNAPSRARRLVRTGDVIVSTVRTYLRAVALIEDAERVVVSTGFAVLRPPASFASRFLWYALQADSFIADVTRNSEGVSYPAIPPERLATIKIPVPPVLEQRAISDFLDRETMKLDLLLAKKKRIRELLGACPSNRC
jgi:type I restriction enzyme, S subunit